MAAIRIRVGRRAWSLLVLLAAMGLVATAAPASAAPGTNPNRLSAFLSGAKEVPGPGDPDGRGRADIQLGAGRLCFSVTWRGIETPTAAHIHAGTRQEAGPVVVLLFDAPSGLPTTVDRVGGCVEVERDLLRNIRRMPADYYVNVHNEEFPAGAIRGQLQLRPMPAM
jgi:CHRD domain